MGSSFDAFKAGGDGEPPDGAHTVWLERTSVFESRAGAWWLRTCWRTTDLAYYWETLNALEGQRMQQTRELVTAVGVNLDEVNSWDEMGDELAQFENRAYIVKVSRNGDFLNTAVTGRAQSVQTTLGNGTTRTEYQPAASRSDIPADTKGLPEVSPEPVPTGGLFEDDDVPF